MAEKFKRILGQSITEYTLLLSVLIAALLFMQGQAKWVVWRNLNAVIKDFKDYGLQGKKDSAFAQNFESRATTTSDSKTYLRFGKESGYQAYERQYSPSEKMTYEDYKYDTYENIPPD